MVLPSYQSAGGSPTTSRFVFRGPYYSHSPSPCYMPQTLSFWSPSLLWAPGFPSPVLGVLPPLFSLHFYCAPVFDVCMPGPGRPVSGLLLLSFLSPHKRKSQRRLKNMAWAARNTTSFLSILGLWWSCLSYFCVPPGTNGLLQGSCCCFWKREPCQEYLPHRTP